MNIALAASTSAGPSCPVKISGATASCSTPAVHTTIHKPFVRPTRASLVNVLLGCVENTRVPTVQELLTLMDANDPAPDLKYIDIRSELSDHGIKDAIDVNSTRVGLLATFGYLGMDGATRLQRYAWERMLRPLGLLQTRGSDTDSLVVEVTKEGVAVKKAVKKEVAGSVSREATSSESDDNSGNVPIRTTKKSREAILQWLEGVSQGLSDIEEVDGFATDTDEASSQPSEEI